MSMHFFVAFTGMGQTFDLATLQLIWFPLHATATEKHK